MPRARRREGHVTSNFTYGKKKYALSKDPNYFLGEHEELDTSGLSDIPFGRELKKEFGLKQDTIFLNHGSYGTVPNRVLRLQHEYNVEREEHPDLFYLQNTKPYLDKAREDIAKFIKAKVDNVMIVSNVTTANFSPQVHINVYNKLCNSGQIAENVMVLIRGILGQKIAITLNALVKNYPFKSDEAILDSTFTYSAIKNLAHDMTSRLRPDVQRVHLNISLPIKSEDEFVASYADILEKHPNIKVAIIDHITSPGSVVLPLDKLIKLCHSKGVLVFVDGAHSIGQLPLDMEALQADAFTSNLHKWCYTPRGCALFWFAEQHRHWINPPNTSRQLMNSLDMQFFDQATRDPVPFICARHGIQFYQAIGGLDKITGYTSKLANDACVMLCEKFGLEKLDVPLAMEAPNMKMLKFPPFPNYPVSEENGWKLQKELFGNSKIYGMLFPMEDSYYLRFSVQVYSQMEDFVQLAEIMKPFLEKFTKK